MHKYLLSIVLLLSPALGFGQDLFLKRGIFSPFEPALTPLTKINSGNSIGGYPILTVTNDYTLLMSRHYSSTGTVVPLGHAVLFTERNKKLYVGLEITANLAETNSSDLVDEPCKRNDFIWKRSTGGAFKDVNCVSINHYTNFFVNPTGFYQQLLAIIRNEGVEYPPTVIIVTFTRYTTNGRRLQYVVAVNPEQFGVERDATPTWGANSWYKDFLVRDSKKIDFVERLKVWAIDVQNRMDQAFAKNNNAFADLKPLDQYLIETSIDQSTQQSTEQKLISLKVLYDKGLISEAIYNERIKSILNGN